MLTSIETIEVDYVESELSNSNDLALFNKRDTKNLKTQTRKFFSGTRMPPTNFYSNCLQKVSPIILILYNKLSKPLVVAPWGSFNHCEIPLVFEIQNRGPPDKIGEDIRLPAPHWPPSGLVNCPLLGGHNGQQKETEFAVQIRAAKPGVELKGDNDCP